tara:strand:+ start:54 stop:689 length:636 start_codon:yes stop_codon:yes gene_type:complete
MKDKKREYSKRKYKKVYSKKRKSTKRKYSKRKSTKRKSTKRKYTKIGGAGSKRQRIEPEESNTPPVDGVFTRIFGYITGLFSGLFGADTSGRGADADTSGRGAVWELEEEPPGSKRRQPMLTDEEEFAKGHYGKTPAEWDALTSDELYALQHFGMNEDEFQRTLVRQAGVDGDKIFNNSQFSEQALTRNLGPGLDDDEDRDTLYSRDLDEL